MSLLQFWMLAGNEKSKLISKQLPKLYDELGGEENCSIRQ